MDYRQLFIWVEGLDDQRFVEAIIKPILVEKYNKVQIVLHAEEGKKYITNYIRSITSIPAADYIFLTDINTQPCVTTKKLKEAATYLNLDLSKIVVIIKEIESWYLAGIDSQAAKVLGIKSQKSTDSLIKEQFDMLIPKGWLRIDFMQEILKRFSCDVAKQKNKSFAYFIKKLAEKYEVAL
ncbi:MAG: hypothetical protein ABH878_02180 [bacterium]